MLGKNRMIAGLLFLFWGRDLFRLQIAVLPVGNLVWIPHARRVTVRLPCRLRRVGREGRMHRTKVAEDTEGFNSMSAVYRRVRLL
jgi:hypothetical protein